MSIFTQGSRAARLMKALRPGRKSAFFAGATIAGASVGYEAAQQGLKREGAKEGAISGAILGAALVATPWIGKNLAKGFKATTVKPAVNRARAYGRVIFRKIRGRIVPVRAK